MSNPYAGLMDAVVYDAPTQPIQDMLSKALRSATTKRSW